MVTLSDFMDDHVYSTLNLQLRESFFETEKSNTTG